VALAVPPPPPPPPPSTTSAEQIAEQKPANQTTGAAVPTVKESEKGQGKERKLKEEERDVNIHSVEEGM
jgi:hypothetical protein